MPGICTTRRPRSCSTPTCSTGWIGSRTASARRRPRCIAAAARGVSGRARRRPPSSRFIAVGRSGHGRLSLDGRSIARRESRASPGAAPRRRGDPARRERHPRRGRSRRPQPRRRRRPGSARADEPLLLGALTLAELDVLLQRELGPAATAGAACARSPTGRSASSPPPTRTSPGPRSCWPRPRSIARVWSTRAWSPTAERLGLRRVATFDRRPIAIFRPRHVRVLRPGAIASVPAADAG